MGLLRGVYPEPYVEILRFAQNDRRRRAGNDSRTMGEKQCVTNHMDEYAPLPFGCDWGIMTLNPGCLALQIQN